MDRFGSNSFNPQAAYEEAKAQARPKRLLCGASIVDYAEREIDWSLNLLGNRWLSRLSGAFLVAPSGHGKSTLITQMAACWSCGKACCGIKPAHPLRVFIAQAEDDENDTIEMAQMLNRLELNSHEIDLVHKNTHIEWLNNCTGDKFFAAIHDVLPSWPLDLFLINPYTAFQTQDIQDNAANANFLRSQLSSVLSLYNCGALIVHHTGKTQYQKKRDFSWFDWMYDMSGGAILTNWARAVLIIAPTSLPGTYKFIAAKRFEKIGWQQREYWFSHSVQNDFMLWVPANNDQISNAKNKEDTSPDDLLSLIPPLDHITQAKLIVAAKKKLGIGEKKTFLFTNVLLNDDKILKIELPRPNSRPEIGYRQNLSKTT